MEERSIDNLLNAVASEIEAIDVDTKYKCNLKPPRISAEKEIIELFGCIMLPDLFPPESLGQSPVDALHRLLFLINSCLDLYFPICEAEAISIEIISRIPTVKRLLFSDAIAIFEGDPAARSVEEIILCYPGLYAVMIYRIAHLFYEKNIPFLPRMMTEHAHRETGIDIHPGARIGMGLCIDHGTGIVVGETAEIGDRVKIYQGVTIGAKSFSFDGAGRLVKGEKRHPTVGNDCIIYAGATILGGKTVIGDGSVIGGNVWLTHSVPRDSRIYYREK